MLSENQLLQQIGPLIENCILISDFKRWLHNETKCSKYANFFCWPGHAKKKDCHTHFHLKIYRVVGIYFAFFFMLEKMRKFKEIKETCWAKKIIAWKVFKGRKYTCKMHQDLEFVPQQSGSFVFLFFL